MLRPVSDRLLERILVFGPAGSGKSTAAASIADMAAKTRSDARFHVIDTDLAWDRMLVEGYPSLSNVDVHLALEWPEYRESLAKIRSVVRPQDWVVVDLVSNAWETVQAYFTEQVFDRDIGDYFLQVRKELKGGKKSLEAFSGWVDWSVINAMYKSWANDLLFKTRANVLCTAKMAKVHSEQDDKATRLLFGSHGVKPEGQKALAYQFHTVLLTGEQRSGDETEYTLTTVKDRERTVLSKIPVKKFALDYLVKVGGVAVVIIEATDYELEPTPWARWAACAGIANPNLFFPSHGESAAEAVAVCAGCPVRVQCADYAVRWHIDHGIWGGLTPRDRRGLVPSDRPNRLPPMHGTTGRYHIGCRCQRCTEADMAYKVDLRDSRAFADQRCS